MSPDNQRQQMDRFLEQLEQLQARLELNLDLIIKRAEELKEQSLKVLQRELEPTFREKYAEAVRDMNAALSVAVEKNQIVLNIFNAAQRLFGQNQNVIRLLTLKELLIDQQAESKLKRNSVAL